jgi:hypothetical protein
MNKQNYFNLQNDNDDDRRNQRIDKGTRGLQKVGNIIEMTFQNHLENLKKSYKYYNNNDEKQKLTRIVGAQANMMIYAFKSGLSFYFKDASIGGVPILDVYVNGKEYEQQCIKNFKVKDL